MKSFNDVILTPEQVTKTLEYTSLYTEAEKEKSLNRKKAMVYVETILNLGKRYGNHKGCLCSGFEVYSRKDNAKLTDNDLEAIRLLDKGQSWHITLSEDGFEASYTWESDSSD